MQDLKVQQNSNVEKRPLLNYEFTGGIYMILLLIFAVLDVVLISFTVYSVVNIITKLQPVFSFMSELDISFSEALKLVDLGKDLFGVSVERLSVVKIVLSILLYIIAAAWLSISTAMLAIRYNKNRDTNFQICDNSISGVGLAKQVSSSKKHKKAFEIAISDLKYIFVNNGFLIFASNDTEYRIMITSIDFNKKLKQVISKFA